MMFNAVSGVNKRSAAAAVVRLEKLLLVLKETGRRKGAVTMNIEVWRKERRTDGREEAKEKES